uniref:Uncharacterized protein n=1 Tax=Knipowitschia caucasica TaxID=637954 RepID=A0AAV2J871_KNICA
MHSYSGSYATDARMRLESLKSGSSSPVPTGAKMELMYNYDFSKDIWQIGQNELSALDSVDLIDVEGDEEDEESWLYVSPKQCAFVKKTESALRWCRHVLDNRSPEMETACSKLINRLNLKLSCEFQHPRLQQTFFHEAPMDHASFSSTFSSGSFDHSDSNYTFQNMSDVYDIARIQEASLRQGNVFTHRRFESPQTLCSKPNATSDVTKENGAKALCSHSARSVEKTCLSPKVTRLHQYKMLRRAQNQGSPGRSSSPMRTSLRSLQAVRSSRSLDIDDNSLDQILLPSPDEFERMTSVNRYLSHHQPASDEPLVIRKFVVF